MVDIIVPAAVSSQLDDSGEERIHIAQTIPGGYIRQPWIPPPATDVFYMYFLASPFGGNRSKISYGSINRTTGEITELAYRNDAVYKQPHGGGIVSNGTDRIVTAGYTEYYKVEGWSLLAGSLVAAGSHSFVGTGFCYGLATDGTYYYTIIRDGGAGGASTLKALSYDGATFAEVGSATLTTSSTFDADVQVFGNYILAYDSDNGIGVELRAYTFDGATFTQVGTLPIVIDENFLPGMSVDDNYIYLDVEDTGDEIAVYTFDGADFTRVTGLADVGQTSNGAIGGDGKLVIKRTDQLEIRDFNGTTISGIQDTVSAPNFVGWRLDPESQLLLVPGGPGQASVSGVYDLAESFTPTIYGSASPALVIPDNNTPVETTLTTSGMPDGVLYATLHVNITHGYRGDLEILLESPDGQTVQVVPVSNDSTPDYDQDFYVPFATPITSNGEWTLTLRDEFTPDEGILNSWSIGLTPAVVNPRFVVTLAGGAGDLELEGGYIKATPELS